MANNDTTKRAALSLLRRGLITKSEAAELAGISRMLMQYWARDINIEAARKAVLAKLWRSAVRKS